MSQLSDVHTFIQLAQATTTPVELDRVIFDVTREMGFDYYALIHHVDLSAYSADLDHMRRGELVALWNYPESWVEVYHERNIVVNDPVLLASQRTNVEGHHPPTSRQLLGIRRRLAQIHRMLDGAQRVFRRLEQDDDLPEGLQSTVEKLSQRLQGLDADALAVQSQLRLLRDELDLQSDQRTNQNLYLLSVMTALMLPATLVTGLFGMNTGDLPFTGGHGTLAATALAAGTALATYWFLRSKGFFR